MKKYAICVALTLAGCTTTQQEAVSDAGSHINLEVDCTEGARVRFKGARAESEDQTGETTTVDPSKVKGD